MNGYGEATERGDVLKFSTWLICAAVCLLVLLVVSVAREPESPADEPDGTCEPSRNMPGYCGEDPETYDYSR